MFGFLRRKRLTRQAPSAAIDEMVNTFIAPILKEEGFKKEGRTWCKDFAEYTLIISVQASRWNSRETGASFTIQHGIYVPSVYVSLFEAPLPKSPRTHDCIFSASVRNPKREGIWWDIYDFTDTNKVGHEIQVRVKEQCLSSFSTVRSLADVARLAEEKIRNGDAWKYGLGVALLYAELGNTDKAKRIFQDIPKTSQNVQPLRDRVVVLAKSYGIRL